jgi:hypothetical protein
MGKKPTPRPDRLFAVDLPVHALKMTTPRQELSYRGNRLVEEIRTKPLRAAAHV